MILEEEAHKKVFWNLHRKQSFFLVARSNIKAALSLQLENDGLSNLHMNLIVFTPWQQVKSIKLLFSRRRLKLSNPDLDNSVVQYARIILMGLSLY